VVFEDAEAGIDAALAGAFWAVGVGSSTVQHAHIVVPGLNAITVTELLNQLNRLQAHTTPA
jgi:beta-phosphoglucomutase